MRTQAGEFNVVLAAASRVVWAMARRGMAPRVLGALQVPPEWLQLQEERLAMRRTAVPVIES